MNEQKLITEVKDIGEFGLIKKLTKNIKIKNQQTLCGVGDDTAVIKGSGNLILLSTDMMVEGVHFDMMFMPLKHLGYKTAVVNFSDIYAMNGIPKQLTVAMAVSSKYSVEALEEIYEGIKIACDKYNVDLVGGDTTASRSGLILCGSILGEVDESNVVYRSGACQNDLLCVTGDLGAAYLGLIILEREKNIFIENPEIQPDLEGQDYIVGRQLKPEARKDIIEFFKKEKIKPTSMIDISDGLSSEVLHICDASLKGCNLFDEKIPINNLSIKKAMDFNLDPTMCALSGGEDYELLFTINQKEYEKVKNHPDISVIGHINEKNAGANLVTKANQSFPLTAQGWDAFLKSKTEVPK